MASDESARLDHRHESRIARAGAIWLCISHAALLAVTALHVDNARFTATLFLWVIGLG